MLSPQTQTLYGIFDTVPGDSNIVRADLLQQTIETNGSTVTLGTAPNQKVYPPGTLRKVSDTELSTQKGWRIDLPALGERVISEATFPSGAVQTRVRFTTLIPDPDPCGIGRGGWLMDIDLISGGRYQTPVFELTGDGEINEDDLWGGDVVSGITGFTGERVTVIRNPDEALDNLYSGDGELRGQSLNFSGPIGRQSWRQLR